MQPTALQKLRSFTRPLGELARPVRSARNSIRRSIRYGTFLQSYARFKSLAGTAGDGLPVRWQDRYPCLDDATTETGFDRHYIYHTAWAARVLAEIQPSEHTDIGSSLYFAGIVSAFLPIRFFDYRPAPLGISNVSSNHADLTDLQWPDESVASLSCMHVVEHVGLGRYGDPLDPDGDRRAMDELNRVLAPGGTLLFVVPVGRPRICYNAHRIYSYEQIRDAFGELSLQQFSLIPDHPRDGGLLLDADPQLVSRQQYACGCFWFRRPLPSQES